MDDYDRAQDVLSEARNRISKGFEDLKEDQGAFAVENGLLDVKRSEILDINAGGSIISVTRGTLTQIKGTSLEALFSGRWDTRLPSDDDSRGLLDVNPKCFGLVVDYLNEHRITPPDCSPKILHLGEDDDTVLQHHLLAFAGRDDVIDQSNIFIGPPNLGQAYDDSDENSR